MIAGTIPVPFTVPGESKPASSLATGCFPPDPSGLNPSTSPVQPQTRFRPALFGLDWHSLRNQQPKYTQTYASASFPLNRLTASQQPVASTSTIPTEDLRKSLGQSKNKPLLGLENDRATTDKNFKNWNKALEAFALGWRRPKLYYPVIISPNSPVSTPQKLQKMAGMTTPPRVFNTTYTTMNGGLDDAHLQEDGKPKEVQAGEVSWRELVEIKNKTECDDWLFVFVDGKVCGATLVNSSKADDDNEEEHGLGGGIQEKKPDMSPREVQTDPTI